MLLFRLILTSVIFLSLQPAIAQTLPGSADIGRIDEQRELTPQDSTSSLPSLLGPSYITNAPQGAEDISLNLKKIEFTGVSAFDVAEFDEFFLEKIGTKINAAFIWELAESITKKYRDHGYFLSKAIVPEQKIADGNVVIDIIEGFVSNVKIEGDIESDRIVKTIINSITSQRPIEINSLESSLLRLNDLYGLTFDARLTKANDNFNGSTSLVLTAKADDIGNASFYFNNYGSKFMGPNRVGLNYTKSFLNYHQTTFSGLNSILNVNELNSFSVNHRVQLSPEMQFDVMMAYNTSQPGHTLRTSDIESKSINYIAGLEWQPIRQRFKNLKLTGKLDCLNTDSDSLGEPFTRDKVRTFRLGLDYNFTSDRNTANKIDLTISKGLKLFNASKINDLNLSRTGAQADFTKINGSLTRNHVLTPSLTFSYTIAGQWTNKHLLSSEEFGYGGTNIGKAYDFSEITGDHGVAGSMILEYGGFKPKFDSKVLPFVFYDIGKVWSDLDSAESIHSAASTGFGFKLVTATNWQLDTVVAYPKTKAIDNPLYGNGTKPVVRFGLTHLF